MTATPARPGEWRQLPLPFSYQPHYAAADLFAAPCNEAALAWLRRMADWPQRRLALWGAEGCGKTHLLHVWAGRSGALFLSGPMLGGPMLAEQAAPPDRPLAIDDADGAPPRPLLHVLNAAAEAGQPVLLSSRTPPARWPVALPDLASRLRSTAAVEIGGPDEQLLRSMLARLISDRQLTVPESVQDWLLARLPRTTAALRIVAERLDRAALAAGRPITRAIAAAVLTGLPEPAEPAPTGMPEPQLW